jgi:hypothetical protein
MSPSMSRRFQFSLGRLMGAVGIIALGLWLLRAALDSERIEVAAAAVVAVPIILGTAIGKLLGSATTGAENGIVVWWFLVFAAIGIASVGAVASQLLKWIY